MKVRFYPKTEVIKGILREDADELERLLAEKETKLAAMNSSIIHRLTDESVLQTEIEARKQGLKYLQSQMIALESHAPPECMAEIEL